MFCVSASVPRLLLLYDWTTANAGCGGCPCFWLRNRTREMKHRHESCLGKATSEEKYLLASLALTGDRVGFLLCQVCSRSRCLFLLTTLVLNLVQSSILSVHGTLRINLPSMLGRIVPSKLSRLARRVSDGKYFRHSDIIFVYVYSVVMLQSLSLSSWNISGHA